MTSREIKKEFHINCRNAIFRLPRPGDLDGLLRLINSVVAERAYLGNQRRYNRREEKEWLTGLLRKIKNKEVYHLIAEIDGEFAGSCEIERMPHPYEYHVGELGIIVMKKFRGLGIGRRLIKTIIPLAKRQLKLRIIKLRIFGPNKKAIILYKRLGFKIVGNIKGGMNYYGKFVDDIIMIYKP